MNALVPFSFDGAEVRVVNRAGEPWFVLADVCRVLEIANTGNASARLDEEDKGSIHITDGTSPLGGNPNMTIINESGLWSLVLTSRKPEARRFKRWITAEVIPAIRKTGGYGHPDPVELLNDPQAMRGLLLTYTEKVLALEAENRELAPKAEALDRLATAEGSLCITDAAKTLQMRPKDLTRWLVAGRWIYRRAGGGTYIGYQNRIMTGLLEHKVTTVWRTDGSEKVVEQVRITPKGLARIAEEAQVDGLA